MGLMAEVERATAGVTQPPPQRNEGAPEYIEGRPVLVDTEAVPLPPPPPLPRTRDAVQKAEAPALAPLKALKVSASATARWVVDTQAALQHGATSARATEAAAKQTGDEAPTPHEAVALEAGDAEVPTIAEATEGEVGAPRTSEAEVADTGASRTIEAKESAQEVEIQTISSDDTSRGKEVADVKAASTAEQPVPTPAEGSSALVRVRPEHRGWDSPRVLWWSRDDPEGEPLAEVEDLRLRCADIKAEAATAREQAAPLAARIEELEEELTRAADERDIFRSRAEQEADSAKAIAEQLEAEKGAHLLTKGALEEAVKVSETSRVDALAWKEKAKGLEKEASKVAEASVEVQAVLEAEIREHNALGHVCERLRGALHTGVKRALAVVSSYYVGVDLEAISDGYVMTEDDEKAEEEVLKLVEAVEAPGMELAQLFEEEVIPPTPTVDAGDPV
ncbi:uncharacterized protein [Miscanthus floridulus]|uniref:uncharacterized protein n=1 Tax=Miscanthus floridulus TaxID=154761 RepID=UPI003459520B